MHGHVDPITHIVRWLSYFDSHLGIEFVFQREGLCSNAGCKCTKWGVVCNNFEYPLFNSVLNYWYTPLCHSSCHCKKSGEGTLRGPASSGGMNDEGRHIRNGTAAITNKSIANGPSHTPNGCLAGEETGWTTKQQANCCPGYAFQTLSLANANPLGDLNASATAVEDQSLMIGACLKDRSTLNLSSE